MTNPLILVADGDPKNLQILKENLEASGFVVITVASGNKAWEEIQQSPPNLVLTEINLPGLTGYQLLERLQADPNTKSIPLVFLTNQREIQQRVRGFELGAKDYLVKPLHVKEVIAHIRMVLRRLERRKTEQLETYMKFSGRLDQLNLADLIENFGVERKTGVLTLSNGRRTGQVYFRDGAVVNASLGDIKQEAAIYQMLPWNRGYFNMVFKEIDVPDEISISNLGLLLHGIKRMEIREKLMGQLSSPRTSFTITPTFKLLIAKKNVNGQVASFVKLFDGKREVEQIIDDSGLDDLVALKRIVRLYQQGFIKPTIPARKKPVLPRGGKTAEEKIRVVSKPPSPVKEPPPPVEIQREQQPSEFDFEPGASEKRDLEKEIKPIFERIEKEKKKVFIPKEKDKQEETFPIPEQEELRSPEPTFDSETAMISETSLDDTEIPTADEAFIDEELIRKSSDMPAETSDREPESPAYLTEEYQQATEAEQEPTDEEIDFQSMESEPEIHEERAAKTASIVDMSKSRDHSKYEVQKPTAMAPMPGRNQIVVISVDDDCKDELMDIFTNDNFVSKNIPELDGLQLDLGRVRFDNFGSYNMLGISVDKPFTIFLESIKSKICGFIFGVDCSRSETWEYSSYLINSITDKYRLPAAVAVMNFLDQESITMDVIRYQLHLNESIPLIAWDPVDKPTIRKLIQIVTRDQATYQKKVETIDSYIEKMTV